MKKTLFTFVFLLSFLGTSTAYAGNVYDLKQMFPPQPGKIFNYKNNITGIDFHIASYPWGDGVHYTFAHWSDTSYCSTEHNVFGWIGESLIQQESYQFDNSTHTQQNTIWADHYMRVGDPAKVSYETRPVFHLNAPNCSLTGSSESYWYSYPTTTWRAIYDGLQEYIPYSSFDPMFPTLTPVVRLDNMSFHYNDPNNWYAEQLFFSNLPGIGWTLVGIEMYRHEPGKATVEIVDVKLKSITNQ